jgi:hypothetical protein
MQNDTSQYVVNIIPLQNIQTNISGLDTVTSLQNQVTSISQMIDTNTKTVYTDYLNSFTAGGSINVLSPLNLSNTTITSNGAEVIGTTSQGLSSSNSSVTLSSSNIVFNVNGTTSLTLSNTSGTFSGSCRAVTFITLSDREAKANIETLITGYKNPERKDLISDICSLNVYKYNYKGQEETRKHIGLLAQEVEEILPQSVIEENGMKYIDYNSLVSLLVGVVGELKREIDILKEK